MKIKIIAPQNDQIYNEKDSGIQKENSDYYYLNQLKKRYSLSLFLKNKKEKIVKKNSGSNFFRKDENR